MASYHYILQTKIHICILPYLYVSLFAPSWFLEIMLAELIPMSQSSKAAVSRCSSKLVFIRISQISQENTCVSSLFLKKIFQLVKFVNFLRTPFLQNISVGYFCNQIGLSEFRRRKLPNWFQQNIIRICLH